MGDDEMMMVARVSAVVVFSRVSSTTRRCNCFLSCLFGLSGRGVGVDKYGEVTQLCVFVGIGLVSARNN